MLYYDPHYLTEKEGASGPPQWVYFTQVNYTLLDSSFRLTYETRIVGL
jgi:hypothetical protein